MACREDFVAFGKNSKSVKEYVEKAVKDHGNANKVPVKVDTKKMDKALAAFKVKDLNC